MTTRTTKSRVGRLNEMVSNCGLGVSVTLSHCYDHSPDVEERLSSTLFIEVTTGDDTDLHKAATLVKAVYGDFADEPGEHRGANAVLEALEYDLKVLTFPPNTPKE